MKNLILIFLAAGTLVLFSCSKDYHIDDVKWIEGEWNIDDVTLSVDDGLTEAGTVLITDCELEGFNFRCQADAFFSNGLVEELKITGILTSEGELFSIWSPKHTDTSQNVQYPWYKILSGDYRIVERSDTKAHLFSTNRSFPSMNWSRTE